MAWVRLTHRPGLVVNLERYSCIEAAPSAVEGGWEVLALPAKGDDSRLTKLFEGTRAECDVVVDEIAKLVWAVDLP
jgi:hypothetical protein